MEILVHISAPSSRKDDDRFRAFASAYDGFEPSDSIQLHPEPPRGRLTLVRLEAIEDDGNRASEATNNSRRAESEYIAQAGERQDVIEQSSVYFTPSLPPAEPLSTVPRWHDDSQLPFPSSKSPLQQLENIHYKWRKRLQSPSSRKKLALSTPAKGTVSSPLPTSASFIENTQLAAAALESQLPWLEDSISSAASTALERPGKRRRASLNVGNRKGPRPECEDTACLGKPVHRRTQAANTTPLGRERKPTPRARPEYLFNRSLYAIQPNGSEAARPREDTTLSVHSPNALTARHYGKRSRQYTTSPSTSPQASVAAKPAPTVQTLLLPYPPLTSNLDKAISTAISYRPVSTNAPTFSSAHPTALDLRSLPNEIHPPPPRTSTSRTLPCQITPTLRHLTSLPSLYPKFSLNLESMSRPLRPTERGHWLVNTRSWELKLQKSSWEFLAEFVGKGGCGWGVWCCREDYADGCSQEKGVHEEGGGGEHGGVDAAAGGNIECAERSMGGDVEKSTREQRCLGIVRVYCWGEVVEHVYLLLWLASNRRIGKKGEGSMWVDGSGEQVVKMK